MTYSRESDFFPEVVAQTMKLNAREHCEDHVLDAWNLLPAKNKRSREPIDLRNLMAWYTYAYTKLTMYSGSWDDIMDWWGEHTPARDVVEAIKYQRAVKNDGG